MLVVFITSPSYTFAETQLRIATYNLNQLNNQIRVARKNHIKQVIQALDADIIALQEVSDRTVLERIFNKNKWTLFLDDNSTDTDNVAIAIRHPLLLLNQSSSATDEDFLFPSPHVNHLFPGRKDILNAHVQLTNGTDIHILVIAASRRQPNRPATDNLKAQAAAILVQEIEKRFDGKAYILLGDFNDSPDDRMLNILETGNPMSISAQENKQGEFLINLTEPYYAKGYVSTGRNRYDIVNGLVNIIDINARERNFLTRNDSNHTGDNLFDQILIPHLLLPFYVMNSLSILQQPVAVKGTRLTIASDHLPVYADFAFNVEGIEAEGTYNARPKELPNIPRIIRALIDPRGTDAGQERIIIRNDSAKEISLDGWRLMDRAGNYHRLKGTLASTKEIEIHLLPGQLPLNNSGDHIKLLNTDNTQIHSVTYTRDQVHEGYYLIFDLWHP